MRIKELRLYPIADPPLRSSYGLQAPFALRTIVELKTDSGLTGVSETYGGDGPLASLEEARPHVVGMDPFALTHLHGKLTAQQAAQAATVAGGRTQTYLVPGENPLDRAARTFAGVSGMRKYRIASVTTKPRCGVTWTPIGNESCPAGRQRKP